LKPYILLKEQTRRSRRRRRRRRGPGASKGFKQPGRTSSKDEDKKNKEPNKLSKITQSFPRKKKRHSKLYRKKSSRAFTKTYLWKKKNNNKPSKAPNQASKKERLKFFMVLQPRVNFPPNDFFFPFKKT